MSGSQGLVSRLLRESGGHRWQRIPPTEKRGRVHTSTVTVAVLDLDFRAPAVRLRDEEIKVIRTRDSGPGGQHRNKTESCVVVVHKATGIRVKSALKSQHQNLKIARAELERRLTRQVRESVLRDESARRKAQVGSGMRADKIRTYREQDDRVVDHRTCRRSRLRDVLAGHLEPLE